MCLQHHDRFSAYSSSGFLAQIQNLLACHPRHLTQLRRPAQPVAAIEMTLWDPQYGIAVGVCDQSACLGEVVARTSGNAQLERMDSREYACGEV